jgi:hypothetical protein
MDRTQVFKLVWRGWFVGVSAIATPLFAILALLPDAPPVPLFFVPIVPLVAALQGLLVGALVLIGLTIWPSKH